MKKKEFARQSAHMLLGIIFMLVLVYSGRTNLILSSILLLVIGSLLINFGLTGKRVPVAHDISDALERKEVRFPGWGAAWYVFGVMLLATLLSGESKLLAGIFVLGISDGLATLAGMWGKHTIPYNKKKTIEGSAVFFVSALFSYAFIGVNAVPLAIITALVESLDLPVDDNFSLPIVCAAYLLVI